MKKRQLIFIPKINPDTFLFFFYKGQTGRSYSLREYPFEGGVILNRADSYGYSADEILSMAKYKFDAPTHRTDDEDFWREKIEELNLRYLGDKIESKQTEHVPTDTQDRSTEFSIKNKNGKYIRSVKSWFRFAPPKRKEFHWKDGRSAKELAKAWLKTGKPSMPKDIAKLFESHPLTTNFFPELGIPEFVTRLDNFKGEHRNHDLILIGYSGNNKIFVSVEAKADETFGDEISKKGSTNPKTKIYERIDLLCRAIFGRPLDHHIGKLRYQLLTGVAGTLIEAKKRKADYAVFVVHEFLSSGVDLVKVSQNNEDFDSFFRHLSGKKDIRFYSGKLHEIGYVNGGKFVPNKIPLLIGKVSTKLKL